MNTETKLIVSPTGPERQFKVSLPAESLCPPEVEWDDYYVGFSGYFGKHGPHVFAAAPEMAEALRKFKDHYPVGVNPQLDEAYSLARAALSKAGG